MFQTESCRLMRGAWNQMWIRLGAAYRTNSSRLRRRHPSSCARVSRGCTR